MSVLGRPFKKLISSLVVITLIFLLILLYLFHTETGSKFVIDQVLIRSDQIMVGEINGTLAEEIKLQQIHFQDSTGFSVAIDEFNFYWKMRELLTGHLYISRIQIEGVLINGKPKSSEKNDEQIEIPSIPLTITLDELIINRTRWVKEDNITEIEHLSLTAKLAKNKLSLSNVSFVMPQIQVTASSEIQMQSDWPLTAELGWTYIIDQQPLTGHLMVEGKAGLFNLNSEIKGLVESTQTGFIKLTTDQLEFNIRGEWQKLSWPLTGGAQYSSQKGRFNIVGTPEQYQTDLNASITVIDQADFTISLTAESNIERMRIEKLQLKPFQGELNLTGDIVWAPALTFDLALTAEQVNPESFGTNIPGDLTIKLTGKGGVEGNNVNAILAIEKITGQINDQPVDISGNVKLVNQQLNIQQLDIVAGVNKVVATGQLSKERADLDLNINAPDLATAWPTLTGSLEGDLKITGSLLKPFILCDLQGEEISFEGYKVGQLSLQTHYNHASTKHSNLLVSAKNIQLAEQTIESLSLAVLGNEAKHTAQFQLVSSLTNLQFTTDGQWDGKKWQGLISQLEVDHPKFNKWQLDSSALLTLSKAGNDWIIDLPNTCLNQKQARLCVIAIGSQEKPLDGQISLINAPMTLVKPWLPESMEILGNLTLQTKMSLSPKGVIAELSGNVTKGKVVLKDGDNVTHHIPISISTIHAGYKEGRLDSRLELGLGKKDYITAIIKAGVANETGIRQLSGTLSSQIVEMDLVEKLIPEISQLKGRWVTDLNIAGSTELPLINGFVQLQNGQFEIPKLGSVFKGISLKIINEKGNPERLLLNLEVKSGKGQLKGEGYIDLLARDNYPLTLSISGEEFEVSRLPEVEVVISPELNINTGKNLTTIKGVVKIDKAKVEIKTLPEGAVGVSEDEVIITMELPEAKKNDLAKINTQITIQFGENSFFTGFGLETQLTGQLDYNVENKKARMLGRATLKEATYRSYGQNLTIRKGEFLFNGPTDNPWVNIEAVRKAKHEDITAILKVTGLLKSTETRIYTEPALPESEALSYLVTGKSINRIGGGEGNALASAALNYGVGKLSWVSDQLGIDEFEFEEGETFKDSAVKLGQYLNPNLFVGLTLGLFSSNYEVNIKYRINNDFSVDSRAGETQRIELKYHLATE